MGERAYETASVAPGIDIVLPEFTQAGTDDRVWGFSTERRNAEEKSYCKECFHISLSVKKNISLPSAGSFKGGVLVSLPGLCVCADQCAVDKILRDFCLGHREIKPAADIFFQSHTVHIIIEGFFQTWV